MQYTHGSVQVIGEQAGCYFSQFLAGRQAEDIDHVLFSDHFLCGHAAAERDHLVKNRLCVPHAAFSGPGDGGQGGVFDFDAFAIGNLAQALDNQGHGDALQVEALAAGDNRRQNFVRFGRREEEFHMRRRFFECFQQGVPCLRGQHVHFVDDVDFVFAPGRRVLDIFADVANVFDLIV